ncbi:latent-transforming growth factor beta-binding protein 4-like [Anarrhichthys ocellatus]|uniref:latent-transforming growth factor beta-binding protein 4-like n=1 Tax=Anarrhichthys ocellatus TaxID=433405 RepID=UPI0012EE79B7|nr:latent-transforming growth factor beta-binding protein 4-like [Anarrhichthys ocellatus]
MESWFCWIHLVILLRNTWSSSPPRYTIHQSLVSFDLAVESCSSGVLTTLATELEVADVLGIVSESMPAHWMNFTFWVGLRKVKNECVVPTLPLRGFKWTKDGSEDSQVSRWAEEPRHTCTTVRCAALKGEWDGSQVTRWGLIPISCKSSYQFICKLRDRETGPPKPAAPEPPKPAAPEPPKPTSPEPPKPAAPEPPKPAAAKPPKHATPAKPEPRPATQKPEAANPEPGLPSLETETGPELQGPDPGSDSCWHPLITSARSISFVNSSRMQVQCWSLDQDLVELRCSGRPAVWRLLDDSPADFTTVCRLCDSGFRKDASGTCVDVDECSSALCRFSCLNTVGSFRCFCSDDDENDKNSPACAETTTTAQGGVLMPVLVAAVVLAAVLLVVVVIVTVKCCLTRRSRKRVEKKKMETRSDDGGDSANETAA